MDFHFSGICMQLMLSSSKLDKSSFYFSVGNYLQKKLHFSPFIWQMIIWLECGQEMNYFDCRLIRSNICQLIDVSLNTISTVIWFIGKQCWGSLMESYWGSQYLLWLIRAKLPLLFVLRFRSIKIRAVCLSVHKQYKHSMVPSVGQGKVCKTKLQMVNS